MKNEILQTAKEAVVDEMKVAHFKRCPCCKNEDLLKFEIDYFCTKCDWDSILFDVYSGNFEKRIAIMNKKLKSKPKLKSPPTAQTEIASTEYFQNTQSEIAI